MPGGQRGEFAGQAARAWRRPSPSRATTPPTARRRAGAPPAAEASRPSRRGRRPRRCRRRRASPTGRRAPVPGRAGGNPRRARRCCGSAGPRRASSATHPSRPQIFMPVTSLARRGGRGAEQDGREQQCGTGKARHGSSVVACLLYNRARRNGSRNRRGAIGVERAVVGRPLPDGELVARARRGDASAYEELVRRHAQIAFRTAYLVAGSAADAEEAAQDAFVKAHRALGRFRPGRTVPPVAAPDRGQRGQEPPAVGGPARPRSRFAPRGRAPREARPRLPSGPSSPPRSAPRSSERSTRSTSATGS